MRFLDRPHPETHHNHDDETGLHLAPRCCCQLSAVSCYVSAPKYMFTIFYVVTCLHDTVNKTQQRERLSFVEY
jgi:hypothetical protein